MPTIRPPRVFGAATAGFALIVGVLAAADPAWAGAVGVDVWNVGELEMELKRNEVSRTAMDRRMETIMQAFTLNTLLIDELSAGERSLTEAVEMYIAANREIAGTATMMEVSYPGGSHRGRVARYLIGRVLREGGAKAGTVDRLRTEFGAAFPGEPGS